MENMEGLVESDKMFSCRFVHVEVFVNQAFEEFYLVIFHNRLFLE